MTCCSRTYTPLQLLLAATQFGGDPREITRLLGLYRYTREELGKAVASLQRSPTSAAEVTVAETCITLLENRLKNML